MSYHRIILICRDQFSWFVNFLQIRGDVISWICLGGGGGGGVERKDNSEKVYFI